ncbi:MAG: carboxypeptidase-like regulatory domain-containing protein [Saprospiraceae bacterium]
MKIEKPCSQDWNSMSICNTGKYCSKCKETVIDFSELDDFRISQIINSNSVKVCGRFNKKQLNRGIVLDYKKSSLSNLKKTLARIIIISALNTAETYSQNPKTEIISNIYNSRIEITFQNRNDVDSLSNLLQGKIIDVETKEPFQRASISIKSTNINSLTDLEGNFIIKVPDSLLSKTIVIIFKYPGYSTKEIDINTNDVCKSKDPFVISIDETTMGLVEVVVVKRKKWWQIWKKSNH